MAESLYVQSEFSRALDCTICMERLEDPKVLSCHHSFCKSCLDGMVTFHTDGSGTITCPMRCPGRTLIPADKTTNDLTVPYQLMSILDAYNKQSIRYQSSLKKLHCSGKDECTNNATLYCLPCKSLLCHSCKNVHNNDGHNTTSYYPVKYDRRNEETKIVCDKHDTFANFYCCDKLICIYCKERDHLYHGVETTQNHVDKLKEVLLNPEYGVNKIEDMIENTFRNAKATELSVSLLKKMLQKTLNDRKVKCLYEYSWLLKKEEKRIMEEFNDVVNKQLQVYPKVRSTDIYQGILEKDNFELVLRKGEIVRNVTEYTKSIETLNIGLTEATGLHPLGNLGVECDAIVTISDRPIHASISPSFSQTCCSKDVSSTSLEKLKGLLDEVLPDELLLDRQHRQDMSHHEKEFPSTDTYVELTDKLKQVSVNGMVASGSSSPSNDNKRLEAALSEVKKRGIDYIRDLCKYKDEDLILTILGLCPAVITMKNLMGNTPLHFASLNGCESVLSRLLSMDSDTIDTVNELGSTPLHYAIENRHFCCVKELIFWNCDTNLVNCSGYTPLEIAEQYQYDEIISLLRQASNK